MCYNTYVMLRLWKVIQCVSYMIVSKTKGTLFISTLLIFN